MSELILIVAIDKNNGIGINDTIPWRLKEDLLRFKSITTGHTVIMGRKTFYSLGKPLQNRKNIILTKQSIQQDNIICVAAIDELNTIIQYDQQVFIIGGQSIYEQFIDKANKLMITKIDKEFDCDTFFPKIDYNVWKSISQEVNFSTEIGCSYSFDTYERI